MEKKLHIELIRNGELLVSMMAGCLDAVMSHTIIYDIDAHIQPCHNGPRVKVWSYCSVDSIDHFDIGNGIVTIYYKSGFILTAKRIYI
jgi:hypothetical protein